MTENVFFIVYEYDESHTCTLSGPKTSRSSAKIIVLFPTPGGPSNMKCLSQWFFACKEKKSLDPLKEGQNPRFDLGKLIFIPRLVARVPYLCCTGNLSELVVCACLPR